VVTGDVTYHPYDYEGSDGDATSVSRRDERRLDPGIGGVLIACARLFVMS
jgi:hypothetical protein